MNTFLESNHHVQARVYEARAQADDFHAFSTLPTLRRSTHHLPGTPHTAAALDRAISSWCSSLGHSATKMSEVCRSAESFMEAVELIDSSLATKLSRTAP